MKQKDQIYFSLLIVFIMICQFSIGMDTEYTELELVDVERNSFYDNLLLGQNNNVISNKKESTLVTGMLAFFSVYYMLFSIVFSCNNYAKPISDIPGEYYNEFKHMIDLKHACPNSFGYVDISGFLSKTQPFSTILLWGVMWFAWKFYDTLYYQKSWKSCERMLIKTAVAGGLAVSIFAENALGPLGYYTYYPLQSAHALGALTFFGSMIGVQYIEQKRKNFDTKLEKGIKKLGFYGSLISTLAGITTQATGLNPCPAEWAVLFFISLQFLDGIFHKKGSHVVALKSIMNIIVLGVMMFTGMASMFDLFHLGREYMTGELM